MPAIAAKKESPKHFVKESSSLGRVTVQSNLSYTIPFLTTWGETEEKKTKEKWVRHKVW